MAAIDSDISPTAGDDTGVAMVDDTELQEQSQEDTIAMAQPITMQNDTQKEEQAKDNTSLWNNDAVTKQSNDIPTDQTAPLKNTASAVPQQQTRKTFIWATLLIIVLIVIVVLALVLTQDKDPVDVGDPPIAVDFSTGVSLVTSYVVNTEVRSRLSRTTITMEVANALDCSSIHAISLQLPLNTRITSLKTISSDECETNGVVQELSEARDTFLESAASGIPSAYVESQDSFTHSLQVAIPPLGITNVELVLEQLIVQRQGKINFEIPLMPNEPIDGVRLDLKVEDTNGEAVNFEVNLDVSSISTDSGTNSSSSNTEGHMHLDIPDARQYELPKTIKGEYNATAIPINGLLKTDGKCFEHFFSPTSLEAMPRNFHFVLDTSKSMNYESKLEDAKKALSLFIDTLSPQDTFTIQTFGNTGTEDLWGSGQANSDERKDAKEFLSALKASSLNTDLHEALLLGLLRAKADAKESEDNVANILVLISDGYATRGETNRTKIAEHVYELNEDGQVKIFSLGFQESADVQLLDAIALMNGGVSIPLLHGQVDFAQQITDFLQSEVGSILMSDVSTEYTGASGETQTLFPVLSSGYEVVVRGRFDGQLEAITHAKTLDGKKSWTATPVSLVASSADDESKASLCFQSYAHDRITQLLRFYDVSDFIGEDMIRRLVTLSRDDCKEDTFAKCIRREALALATEANIVAKGLTAMVTLDDDQCTKLDEEAEICLDGTTPDGTRPPSYEHDHAYPETMTMSDEMDYGYDYRYTSGSATLSAGLLYIAILSIFALFS